MSKKSPRPVTLREYVAEVLKNAVYEKGEVLDVIVAEAPDLPGCLTQGVSVEEARENLIDAIEVWIMAGLQSGEELPVVNGCRLAITMTKGGLQRAKTQPGVQTRVGA
jgi:predicted RNase H-like HicB family nuclease